MANNEYKPETCGNPDVFDEMDYPQAEDSQMRRGGLPLRRGSR